jgi:hypothetical protein
VLTGVAFQADAARNLIRADPARADALLGELRGRTAEAIEDIRRPELPPLPAAAEVAADRIAVKAPATMRCGRR